MKHSHSSYPKKNSDNQADRQDIDLSYKNSYKRTDLKIKIAAEIPTVDLMFNREYNSVLDSKKTRYFFSEDDSDHHSQSEACGLYTVTGDGHIIADGKIIDAWQPRSLPPYLAELAKIYDSD